MHVSITSVFNEISKICPFLDKFKYVQPALKTRKSPATRAPNKNENTEKE